jgi:hypothetical protein
MRIDLHPSFNPSYPSDDADLAAVAHSPPLRRELATPCGLLRSTPHKIVPADGLSSEPPGSSAEAGIDTVLAKGFDVTMPHDTHATYNFPEAPGLLV